MKYWHGVVSLLLLFVFLQGSSSASPNICAELMAEIKKNPQDYSTEVIQYVYEMCVSNGQGSNLTIRYDEDHVFTLRDVERKCEAWKWSDSWGDIECRGSQLRPVEKRCEAYFYDSKNGALECRGSVLRVLERRCSIRMYSENYGEINC